MNSDYILDRTFELYIHLGGFFLFYILAKVCVGAYLGKYKEINLLKKITIYFCSIIILGAICNPYNYGYGNYKEIAFSYFLYYLPSVIYGTFKAIKETNYDIKKINELLYKNVFTKLIQYSNNTVLKESTARYVISSELNLSKNNYDKIIDKLLNENKIQITNDNIYINPGRR